MQDNVATEKQDSTAKQPEVTVGKAVTTFQAIERDDREARQLLQLSRYEGRDPLLDATIGRLAIDRLDQDAESHRDPQKAKWADQLRRELRERFDEIAPTKLNLQEI